MIAQQRQGERYYESCVMATVKHLETIHVWGCFLSREGGLLKALPQITAMNKEWYQNILQNISQWSSSSLDNNILSPTWWSTMLQGKFYHQMAQWIKHLNPWPENSPERNPIENL